jgi:lipid II:glycine glycyltransferase (peptidoglycan interpeptide bridge formation enzyme)
MDWLAIVRESQRLQLLCLGIFDGKELVGIFPLFLKSFGPLTVAASPLVVEDTHYLGPVVADELLPEVMREFVFYMEYTRINYTRIIFRHDYARKPFADLGYDCANNVTHIVDLRQDPETLWKRVKSPCQRQIRKAARVGVTTEIVCDDRYLDSYYRLVMDLYARQSRTPPSPAEFFRGVWSRFGTKGDLVWVVAKHKGELAAGALLALWKGSVYYVDGVSSSAYSGLGASNAMHWAAIQWAKTEGYSFYDFVGSNVPRFFQFKSSFGGDLTTYLILERSRPRWVRALRHHYARYKGVVQRIKHLKERWSA